MRAKSMIHFARQVLKFYGLAGLVSLSGCVAAGPPVAQGPAKETGLVFSLDTPINRIAADPRGKAVLDRDLPAMMASPSYLLFSGMSLSQLAPLSGGHLTPAKLKRVKEDLDALSSGS